MEFNRLYESVYAKLESSKQLSLLRFYESLNVEAQEKLLLQLDSIDYNWITKSIAENLSTKTVMNGTEPIDVLTITKQETQKEEFHKLGLKALKQGHVAVVLLAGGQGTRLGLDAPKGTFNIGITRTITLFEIIIKKLLKTSKDAERYIDLYIMVSEKNASATKDFFEMNHYFEYSKEHIIFFKQQMVPKVLFNGEIVLDKKDEVAMAPNGNGGWLASLKKNNLYAKMKKAGISWINLLSVDNPLYRIVDSCFLGAVIKQKAQLGIQVVEKNNAKEKVGVICKQGNRTVVREYYEMAKEEQEAVNEKNELRYRYGVILNYMFQIEALDQTKMIRLPNHLADNTRYCKGKRNAGIYIF